MPKQLYLKALFEYISFNFSAKTPEQVESINYVICDYLGHQNRLTCKEIDKFLDKSLEAKCPEKAIPLLKNHRSLMYYPNPKIITNIIVINEF